jgi:hypothetical protein
MSGIALTGKWPWWRRGSIVNSPVSLEGVDMANGDKSGSISQSEFYTSLAIIWLYITLTVSSQLQNNESLNTRFLFGGALLMTFWQVVCVYRCRVRRGA